MSKILSITYEQLAERNHELVIARMRAWLFGWAAVGMAIAWAVSPLIFREKSTPSQTCERPDIMQLDPETIRTKPGAGVWL